LRHELHAFARLQFGTKKPAAQMQIAPGQRSSLSLKLLKQEFLRRSLRTSKLMVDQQLPIWNQFQTGVSGWRREVFSE